MLIYRFKPDGRTDHRVALSNDKAGANLPADGAPWQSIGEVDLSASTPWINVPKDEIEAAITKRGFFVWGISVPAMKKRFQV